ncbi:hypothetical protein [Microbacterium thalli]|uniref:PepSY domain-containing protein n=1 Tax=Microbacterium thalli TaxID=3027921 RepID=A0ABT5SDA8_9MICO|nr:hypothetical protein [Microbacterium thalli]MDD7960775.1 hypothetical protein [Microbacterium thalli]
MNDNDTTASTPPSSPEGATSGAPETVPTASSPAPTTTPDATPTTGAKPRRRGRTALVAGAAVVAAALLAGGGVAVGAAIADDDDDDDRATSVVSTEGDRGAASVGALPEDLGAASADDLVRIVDAALAAAPGEVVAIDAERDGTWDVTVIGADRGEAEVTVTADGAATVRSTEATGTDAAGPQNVLDAATLRMLAEAALTQADGRIVSIDADDDARSPFEVSIATADRGVIEVALDTDGTVLATETDD